MGQLARSRRASSAAAGLALLGALVVAVAGSQWLAYTPPIRDGDGDAVRGGIASLETVTLHGSKQWIMVRGRSVDSPVLLFLAGGPGGSEFCKTRGYARYLEDHFVVVNWDQPAAGKSWHAVPVAGLTPQRYLDDAHELVLQLRARFHQDKIYLLGDSWGSAVGIMLVQRYPQLFHAYIGAGQMVDFVANDTREWELAIQFARQRGDAALVARLESYGRPPYYDNPASKIQTFADVVGAEATRQGAGGWPGTFAALLASPEYGLLDKVMLPINALRVMNAVYPQLYHIDLRTQAATLQVPVYLLEGRYDYNAVTTLAVDYHNTLTAPHKELIWFEHSGHNVLPSEPDKVEDVLVNRVLAQTQPDR